MANSLEMPDSFAGFRIQGEKAIRKKVVANPVSAVEIKCGGARWRIEDSALAIEAHARPIICGTAGLPGVLRSGFVAKFARMWNGVKRPAQFAASDVEGTNVTGRRRESFRIAAAENH